MLALRILQPIIKLLDNVPPRPPQAPLPVPAAVVSLNSVMYSAQKEAFRISLSRGHYTWPGSKETRLTMS